MARALVPAYQGMGRGVTAMLAASLMFALMGALAKATSATLPPMEVAFLRSFGSWVLLVVAVAGGRLTMKVRNLPAMVVRCLAGSVSMAAYFWTLAHLPLADATILTYTSPIFTALAAWWILQERPDRSTWIGLLVAVAGTAVLVRPDSHLWQTASAIGILGAVLSGLAMTQLRELGKTEDPWTIVFWYMTIASALTLPAALPDFRWPSPWTWAMVVGMGVTATAAQGLMTIAYQRMPAALASTASLATVLMVAVLGMTAFHEVPGLLTWIGGGLILGGGLVAGMRRLA